MEINIFEVGGKTFAEINAAEIVIKTVQDALDLMANCRYQGSDLLIMQKEQFGEEFFDLKTKVAGEILQKFSNYRCRLAIIGDYTNIQSKSLKDFIYESNKVGRICFVGTKDEAVACLSA